MRRIQKKLLSFWKVGLHKNFKKVFSGIDIHWEKENFILEDLNVQIQVIRYLKKGIENEYYQKWAKLYTKTSKFSSPIQSIVDF